MSRANIIQVATGQLGVTEFPAGSNETPYNVWFGLTGDHLTSAQKEWCCIFYCWLLDHAGHGLGKGDYLKGFASVPFFYQHFKEKITQDPLPGDAVIFDWQKNTKPEGDWTPDHIGCFYAWLDRKAGTFETIEGNTSVSNNSNGGAVMKRQRNLAFVQAFINATGLPA